MILERLIIFDIHFRRQYFFFLILFIHLNLDNLNIVSCESASDSNLCLRTDPNTNICIASLVIKHSVWWTVCLLSVKWEDIRNRRKKKTKKKKSVTLAHSHGGEKNDWPHAYWGVVVVNSLGRGRDSWTTIWVTSCWFVGSKPADRLSWSLIFCLSR